MTTMLSVRAHTLRRQLDGLNYYCRHFRLWHDRGLGRPPHERLGDIITNDDHRFLYSARAAKRIRKLLYRPPEQDFARGRGVGSKAASGCTDPASGL